MIEFDPLSNRVIGCAIAVHRGLGPGLLESAYEQCLAREFSLAELAFEVQKSMPVEYKGFIWIADIVWTFWSKTSSSSS